ncbi:hypothetical protein HOG16_04860 [Candidatus Woesearchaeota archaeon]|jgi:hypothetical protein|nr:hypothetical protein [Candidatus Woesearchaeota archaeon]MBT4321741.1 hypothetical protein [Candidatus Woesearchaeota archaeon]MBT4631167.1 hypothetical protein [Candidatus Woesearchaeota archaeon]
MKKEAVFWILAILIISGMFIFSSEDGLQINPNAKLPTGLATGNAPKPVDLNYNNLALFLSKTQFVEDIPKNSIISIKFYNFNSGERQLEKSFILKKGEVHEGTPDNEDLVILIHSKYIQELNTLNFCSTISKARNNGDLGIEYGGSEVGILWKFRSMKKHSECFGF